MLAMVETGDLAASMMIEHIREKMTLALARFQGREVSAEEMIAAASGLKPDVPTLDLAFEPEKKLDAPIPEAITTDRSRSAFGHRYEGQEIAESAWSEAITKEGGESGGGQCKALNTLLGDKGFTGKERHLPCTFLLHHLTGRATHVESISDLTKAEATLLIDWLSYAPVTSIDQLKKAIDDWDPFDDANPFTYARQPALAAPMP